MGSRELARLDGGTELIVSMRRGNCGFWSAITGDVTSEIVLILEILLELKDWMEAGRTGRAGFEPSTSDLLSCLAT